MASVQWFPTEILKDDQLDFSCQQQPQKDGAKCYKQSTSHQTPHSDKAR